VPVVFEKSEDEPSSALGSVVDVVALNGRADDADEAGEDFDDVEVRRVVGTADVN
jgi:hypothetical protein